MLKAKTPLEAGEIIDAAVMSPKALRAFFAEQIEAAKKEGVLFSLHVKATMMKIADPIVFGHAVSVFFADVIEKHAATLKRLGVNLNNGFGDLLTKIETLPEAEKKAIKDDIAAEYAKRPGLAMVNSDKGITGLHVPSDFIIDASMPAMIREVRPHVGPRRQAARHHGRDPGSRLRDGCFRRSSRTARPTARSIPRPWARFRTWG